MKAVLRVYLVIIMSGALGVMSFCAKKERSNPLDPASSNYTPPEVEIISAHNDGDTIAADSISFILQGNSGKSEFSHRLDNDLNWTPFSSNGDIALAYLDDGLHTFEVRTKYQGWTDTKIYTFKFTVSALKSPALYLYPQKASAGSGQAIVQLKVSGFSRCNALSVTFTGATIDSAVPTAIIDPNANGVFYANNVMDMLIAPNQTPLSDSATIAKIYITPPSTQDTSKIAISASTARYITSDSIQTIAITQSRGSIMTR
ncbi:MAG: hypothetical protein GF398_12180 [Chitinivibrionales bacterium]|nr:hypothetical protein [Chitinivibrionales bacterium]